jgi:hypothetical protein
MLPAVAAKLADADPASTVTDDAGTGSSVLLLDSDTTLPPVGAAPLSPTVHVVAAPEFKLVGLHANEDKVTAVTAAGAVKLMLAVLETPLRVAVKVALWVVEIVPAVAVKFADADPAGTVTDDADTGSSVLLLAKDTTVPPVGATALNPTVQVVAPPEFKLVGLQVNDDNATGGAVRLMVAVCEMPAGTAAVAWFE